MSAGTGAHRIIAPGRTYAYQKKWQNPCVTLRGNTGRPETIGAGANMLAGTDVVRIIGAAGRMLSVAKEWQNPYGDGNAGERIVRIYREMVGYDDFLIL